MITTITKQWLEQKYLKDKLSLRQIGRIRKVNYETIRNRLKEYHIPRRTRYEGNAIKNHLVDLQDVQLTDEEIQILYGSVLGDGYLGKQINTNAYYSESHGLQQTEYLRWKYIKLRRLMRRFTVDKVAAHMYSYYLPVFTMLHKRFYVEGIKRVTRDMLEILTPLGLSVWYMDDGGCNSYKYQLRNIYLNTQGFSIDENTLIRRYFLERYNLQTKEHKVKGGCGIALGLNVEESYKFIDIVKDYIPDCMSYKVKLFEGRVYKKPIQTADVKQLRQGKNWTIKMIAENLDINTSTVWYHLHKK